MPDLATWHSHGGYARLQDFDIDTDRMPLGQLSKEQVQRGYMS